MANNQFTLEMRGFKEAKKAFRDVVLALDPATSDGEIGGLYRIAKGEIQQALAGAGQFIRDKARSNAAVTKSPRRLYTGSRPAIFAFSDFSAARDDKRKRAVLVGVRTGLSYRAKDERLFINWGKGHRRQKDNSVAHGGLSMSFGALFERGTKNGRVRASHYFQAAVGASQHQITAIIGRAYQRAVAIMNQATGK